MKKNMNKLIFFAQEASFYSGIVRPMLRYKNIPFILLSDNDLGSSNNIFSSSGANKILKKPFKFSELLESIGLTTA